MSKPKNYPTKSVHLDDQVHDKLRTLAFEKRSNIQKEVNDILRKELEILD